MSARPLATCAAAIAGALLAGACGGTQSALNPAGPYAARISGLWWIFFSVLTLVYGLVLAALAWAIVRRRRDEHDMSIRAERRLTQVVVAATGVTVVVLLIFLAASVATGRGITSPAGPGALEIEVTGHQWWWEVTYKHREAWRQATTANEIHVPVGMPVVIKATSRDVIHSLWVPNLHGKRDLIPGQTTFLTLQADTPGIYRGQCAEFCGYQHAHMALLVVAEAPATFSAWLDRQRQAARAPQTADERRGREVFTTTTCVMCHTIRGTEAASRVGPDLTHVGGRLMLAAATIPNTRGHLAGWIVDSQRIKPGNRMPPNALPPDDLQALLTYLQSLK